MHADDDRDDSELSAWAHSMHMCSQLLTLVSLCFLSAQEYGRSQG